MTFVAVSVAATRPAARSLRLRWVIDEGGRLIMSWTTDETTVPCRIPVSGQRDGSPSVVAA